MDMIEPWGPMERFINSRKRKWESLQESTMEEDELFFSNNTSHEEDVVSVVSQVVAVMNDKKKAKKREGRVDRSHLKVNWDKGYESWSDKKFKKKLRVTRATFELILGRIYMYIVKTPTNIEPNPIEPHRQLALTLYRLGHGVSFSVLEDVFGVSISLGVATFNKVIRVMITQMYDDYIFLPRTEEEWIRECKGFIENYEFPCVGAWDGFHVHVCTRLKNFYSFKNKYTITNMGLVGYNKRFLALTAGAPGSTHDARLLRCSKAYKDVISGEAIPDKAIDLGDDIGEIPLVTVADSAFPRFSWLLKMFNENTQDPKQKYYNTKICGSRVVTENCYGMLKGRFRILYKRCECKLYNCKYIVMVCAMLHNLCIDVDDPCLPRWKKKVEHLEIVDKRLFRNESKQKSYSNALKIADWLWAQI